MDKNIPSGLLDFQTEEHKTRILMCQFIQIGLKHVEYQRKAHAFITVQVKSEVNTWGSWLFSLCASWTSTVGLQYCMSSCSMSFISCCTRVYWHWTKASAKCIHVNVNVLCLVFTPLHFLLYMILFTSWFPCSMCFGLSPDSWFSLISPVPSYGAPCLLLVFICLVVPIQSRVSID